MSNSPAATQHPPQIILVEDNPGDVFIFRQALKSSFPSYSLQHFDDADKILHWLDEVDSSELPPHPDLFVIDLNLPSGWGGDIIARIRRSKLKHTAILVSSSFDAADQREKIASFGALYFKKPLNYDEYMKIGTILANLLSNMDGDGNQQDS